MNVPTTSRRTALLTAFVLLATSGCTRSRTTVPPTPAPTASTSSASPTDPVNAEKAAVIAAYRAYYAAAIHAGTTANSADPRLREWATDDVLKPYLRRLDELHKIGATLRGTVHLDPHVTRLGATEATVEDCQDSSGWLVYDSRGTVTRPGRPRLDYRKVRMVRDANGWKVAEFVEYDDGGPLSKAQCSPSS